jgi:hypothetical protein
LSSAGSALARRPQGNAMKQRVRTAEAVAAYDQLRQLGRYRIVADADGSTAW